MLRLRQILISPYLLLALTALFWSGNFIVGRLLRDDVPPLALNWWRWAVAFVLFLPFVWGTPRRQWHLALRHWRYLLLLSASGIACFHSLLYIGISETTAVNAGIIMSVSPVMIVLLSWLLFRDRITAVQGVGVLVSLAGVLLIVSRGDPAVLESLSFNPGDFWVLLATASWGLYSVLLKRKPPELEPRPMIAAIMLCAVLMVTPLHLAEAMLFRAPNFTPAAILGILYVAFFASTLAYICWNRGVAEVGANKAGLFMHLIPVFSAILAFAILGERLGLHHLGGFALILGGIVLAARGRQQRLVPP